MDPSVPPPMMDAGNPYSYMVTLLQLLITFLTLLGTVWVGLYSAWREYRNRKWAIEDEAKRKLEVKEAAEKAAEKLEAKIETKITAEAKTTNHKIDENTELSKKAFTEANNLNSKIAKLQRQIYDAGKSGRLTPEEVKLLRAKLAAENDPPPPRLAGEESTDSSDINFLPKEISNKPKPPKDKLDGHQP